MVRASILPDGWTYRPGLPKGDATYTLADYQALAAELGWRGFTDMQPDEQLYFGRTAVDLLRYEAATGRDMGAAWDGLYRTPQLAQSADFRMGGAMAAETIGVATVVVSGAGALGVISPKGANVRMVNPENIRFSQDSIKAEFKDPRFGTIDDLAAGLRGKTIKPGDIEPIRVVVRNGELVSIDNRRLEAFRRAGVEVPVRMATPSEIREAIRQGKFSAGELGSPTIRVRGGGG
jgi:hypothetical protein